MRLAQQTKASPDEIRSRILGGAIERAQRGSRNEACLWLGCQHRDNGLDQAQAELDGEIVAATVGGPDFTRKEAINAVRSAYRRPPREPWGKGFGSLSSYRPRAVLQKAEEIDQRNVARALRLWSETAPLPGTVGADYYAGRGLSADQLERAVRFHPRSPFGGERRPCVVALLRDIETDEPCGIHRTAISSDGKKIGRKMLGRAAKAAVKLTLDTDVTMGLGIAEGVETALSVLQSGWMPLWAALSAGSIERFPVLPGIEHLTIWADHDPAGLHAGETCARRWAGAGAGATIRYPLAVNTDFNDRRTA